MLLKASSLLADEICIDLEDAVVPADKTADTRRLVIAAARDHAWVAPTLSVRVNAVGTPWCLDDILEVVAGAGDVLDSLVIPKVESAAQLHFVSQLLAQVELREGLDRPIGLEAQIESPRGLVEIESIASASSRLEALVFGPGDFAAAAGMPQLSVGGSVPSYPGHVWHYALARLATTARAFGLQAIDGPYAEIRDFAGLAESASLSKALGFDGKWALHPDQIAACNQAYTPTGAELERAERIIEALTDARDVGGRGAALFESEMVDDASRRMAEAVVQRARAAGLVRGGIRTSS